METAARPGSAPDALELFAAWVSGRDTDDPEAFEALVAVHPELAAELRELHATWRRLAAAGGESTPSHADAGSASLRTGERIGRYAIEGEIARGGMGAILRAWDSDLRRHLAMKVILDDDRGADDRGRSRALARFLEEARVTGQLDHPGIVPVHELGLDSQGRAYFTMKLVEGRDLREILGLVREGRDGWSTTRALGVVLKVCEAMAYAHAKGVVHRDLKPANVMVGSFGEVFVMDWGLSRVMREPESHDLRLAPPLVSRQSAPPGEADSDDSPLLTVDGDVIGTPAYMPPEQARGEIERLSPRSDVYSIGAMLYHLLAGRMPYAVPGTRTDHRAALAKVVAGPPEPLATVSPAVPEELCAICEKAMAREPEARYPDTLAFAEDLRAFLENRVVAAYETGAAAELRKWIARNRALAAASAAALAILVVGLVVGWSLSLVAREQARRADERTVELKDANRALALANARAEEKAAEAERERNLAEQRAGDVLSLSAGKDLEDLVAKADGLWPARQERVPALETWIREARGLIDGRPADPSRRVKARPGLDGHRRKLQEIRRRALPEPPERVAGQRGARFADPDDAWWHAQLSRLVGDLEAFADPGTGLFSSGTDPHHGWGVPRRLESARTLAERSVSGPVAAARWAAAIASIRDRVECPAYAGLVIAPQLGLLPLGRDPDSGLHEFAHLETGEPAVRGADGRLSLDESTGLVLVLVPGGVFAMGSQASDPAAANFDPDAKPNESPVHEVSLDPYFLSKYEMTQGQWERFSGSNPSTYGTESMLGWKRTTPLHPVENVSWEDATRVLARLGLVLPTEAQWERAARAGTSTPWWTGEDKASLAGAANLADAFAKEHGGPGNWRYDPTFDDGYVGHAPVGSYRANAFGFHDVHGNVSEICREGVGSYEDGPLDGEGAWEAFPENSRALRGGSYVTSPARLRVALRLDVTPGYRDFATGLRPARRLDP